MYMLSMVQSRPIVFFSTFPFEKQPIEADAGWLLMKHFVTLQALSPQKYSAHPFYKL